MRIPTLDDPTRYAGLYVIDFGEQTAVGYTAREVEILLDHEAYRDCRVYKIHGALPDGRLELKGVSPLRFQAEEGMFFHRRDEDAARSDFEELRRFSAETLPPCRAKLHLARLEADEPGYVLALIYPAEYGDEIARWLLDLGFRGGDYVEGGISQVTNYYECRSQRLASHQLWGAEDADSRVAEQVLATTHLAVQR